MFKISKYMVTQNLTFYQYLLVYPVLIFYHISIPTSCHGPSAAPITLARVFSALNLLSLENQFQNSRTNSKNSSLRFCSSRTTPRTKICINLCSPEKQNQYICIKRLILRNWFMQLYRMADLNIAGQMGRLEILGQEFVSQSWTRISSFSEKPRIFAFMSLGRREGVAVNTY